MNRLSSFEQDLLRSYQLRPINPRFKASLLARLKAQAQPKPAPARYGVRVRAYAAAAVVLLACAVLVIGPGKVYAQLRAWLSYLPGAGLVDRSQPLRVLKNPVSVTQNGITVRTDQALLSADQTWISYHVFGLSQPQTEASCEQAPYLRLPDGSQLNGKQGRFPAVSPHLDHFSLVIPCLADVTLPPGAPVWELSLEFVPAPPDLPLHEVTLLEPNTSLEPTPQSTAPNFAKLPTATQVDVFIDRVILTESAYILDGRIQPKPGQAGSVKVVSLPLIRDARGNYLIFSTPTDLRPDPWEPTADGGLRFAFTVPMANTAFPITLQVPIKLVPEGVIDQQALPTWAAAITWAPAESAATLPAPPSRLCVSNESFTQPASPADTLTGTIYWQSPSGALYRSALDGSDPQEIAAGGQIAASLDGSRLAWANADGLTILTTADGQRQNFPNLQPTQMLWSPQGYQLALALDPNWPRRAILNPQTGEMHSSDALSQEHLAGFSADANLLYLLIPGSTGDGSLLMAYDIRNETLQELFYLDHRSAKGPLPVVSADGNWLAYLGTAQGSIFIQPLDGGPARQVMDAPGEFMAPSAIDNLIWTTGNQIAFNYYATPASSPTPWLLDLDTCALQALPLAGTLLAIQID